MHRDRANLVAIYPTPAIHLTLILRHIQDSTVAPASIVAKYLSRMSTRRLIAWLIVEIRVNVIKMLELENRFTGSYFRSRFNSTGLWVSGVFQGERRLPLRASMDMIGSNQRCLGKSRTAEALVIRLAVSPVSPHKDIVSLL